MKKFLVAVSGLVVLLSYAVSNSQTVFFGEDFESSFPVGKAIAVYSE